MAALAQLLPLAPGREVLAASVPFSAQAEVLTQLAAHGPVVHVLPQDKDAARLAELCRFLAPKLPVFTLPAWDTLPYDRVSPSGPVLSQRLNTLGLLAGESRPKHYLLLTTLNAATQKLPARALLADAYFRLKPGESLKRDKLFAFLESNGYRRAGKVMEAGEYAVRGSLIDLFPAGAEEGIRVDLFGDEIESLRGFDPLTQLSGDTRKMLELRPVSEVLLTQASIEQFRARYRDLFGAVMQDDPLYETISAHRNYAGMEHWLPLFYETLDTLADYTQGAVFSMDHRIPALHAERESDIADYYAARRDFANKRGDAIYHPVPPESLFLSPDAFAKLWQPRARLAITPFTTEGAGVVNLPVHASRQLFHRKPEENAHPAQAVNEYLAQEQKPVVLAATSFGSAERIRKLLRLKEADIAQSLAEALKAPPALAVLPIEQGYETAGYVVLTEEDMFGERIIRTQKKRRKSEAFLQEAASFVIGELIVHREHGIGRFEGLVTLDVNGMRHDCLKLAYDGGTLFLPVENIDLISRYGTSEEAMPLDKLGGVAWQKRKAALKKRLKIAAEALLKTAAERAAKAASVLTAEAGAYDEFCARFPYSETDDQLSAIEDVKTDLASGHAMDRLICGDVGFGKTEVALRAAFIAASSGQQVAVIAPTTLLARQHYHTFSERFEGLPYTVRMLSRLTPAKQAAETKSLLAEGKVDIVIGTHALLASSVQFKKLALLIVDEEQHFGVGQKEKLKALKSDIHVLTLSATPIPRTLQMALSGVRELSLIATPPVDRLAVRTHVMPFDPVVVREAILRETHRGGRVFYVTPRIKYMAELEVKLRELVPEIKIAVAHGQVAATALDKTMNAFYDGKYDLLLSTAIIESGLDIPSANTIFIDRAQMFGLSQLYQLRGRVGRGKTRAYAYFTLPHHKLLTRDAERRLEVMQQLDSLGAGFAIASHDMDIRGFGNLLGEEQSGHVKEVGIELYQTMLEETVADLKRRRKLETAEETAESWSPQVNLGMSVLIPDSYIEDLPLRLSLYRRAAGLATEAELESFAAELTDRFGALPSEVEHLLAVLRIKILCKRAGIARLDAGPKGVVIAFRENKFAAPEALIAHIARQPKRIRVRSDQTLLVALESEGAERVEAVQKLALELFGLIPAPAASAA